MAILFLILMPVSFVAAQVGGGSVVGVITDEQDSAVPGAKVVAVNTATNGTRETLTNTSGYFEFPLLPAGTYQISVDAKGFQNSRSEKFVLNTGTHPRLDLKLKVGTVSESVNVTAEVPLVNATSTDLGVVMQTQRIEQLPLNGRNFQQLVGLQAGVLNTPPGVTGGRGGIEFNGSPAYGNNLLLDGVDMSFGENNALGDSAAGTGGGGSLINTVSVEGIQEFKATGSAFSAEFGRATGGVLQVTTKSGTNQFHGTLFHFLRNNKLDANSFFNNRVGLARPPLRLNQYGGNIGGPIKKDKLFFFFNYEGAQVRRASTIQGNVPTPLLLSRVTPGIRAHLDGLPDDYQPTANPLLGLHRRNDARSNDENTYMSRADYRWGNHQSSVRYNYNRQTYDEPNLRPDNRRLFPMRYHNSVVQDTWSLRPTVYNELRLGFNRTSLNRVNSTLYTQPGWVEVTGAFASDFQSQLWFITNSFTLADNFTAVRGGHTLKMGFEIRDNRTARVQDTNVTHFYNNVDDLIADRPNNVRVTFGNPGGKLNSTNYGFFFQDDWRVNRRLQVNLGLRYEYFTPLKGGFNIATTDPFGPFNKKGESMFFPDRNNFGPRAGIVWSPFGDQKTVIRAGSGIGYSAPQAFFYYDGSFISPQIPFNAIFTPADVPASVSLAFPFPQNTFRQGVIQNPAGLPRGLVLGRNINDPDRADEYAIQWNLSLQRQMNKSLSMQLSYAGSRALKLITTDFPNIFAPKGGPRPRPEFGEVGQHINAGASNYNAMQFNVNQRMRKGMTLDFYYTWAKGMTYFGADTSDAASREGSVQDFTNVRGSIGPKVTDLRHRALFVYSYEIPLPPSWNGMRAVKFVLGGWTTQGFIDLRTGFPVNVLAGADLGGTRRPTNQRPDYVGGDIHAQTSDRFVWLNKAAFDTSAALREQRFGNLGYNAARAPGAISWDAAIHKTFPVREGHTLNFRFEMFNAANHMNPSAPVATFTDPNFGRITNGSGGRNLQLALKYRF
jgi:outer membrane receptor protein involved in Fe transport